MKTFLSLLSLLSLAGLLMTTGCAVEERGRGGYYGPHEYDHGYYHHDLDEHHDGYWDRGHYRGY